MIDLNIVGQSIFATVPAITAMLFADWIFGKWSKQVVKEYLILSVTYVAIVYLMIKFL